MVAAAMAARADISNREAVARGCTILIQVCAARLVVSVMAFHTHASPPTRASRETRRRSGAANSQPGAIFGTSAPDDDGCSSADTVADPLSPSVVRALHCPQKRP